MAAPAILTMSRSLGPDAGPTDIWAARGLYSSPPDAIPNPIDTPRPIMSRLPVANLLPSHDTDGGAQEESYIQSKSKKSIPGTPPYDPANDGVTYTSAHLPNIDETSIRVWKALHGLRPRCSDFTLEVGRGIASIAAAPEPSPASTIEAKSKQTCPFTASSSSPSTSPSCPFTRSPKQDLHIPLLRTLFNWSTLRLSPAETHQTAAEAGTEKDRGQARAYYGVLFLSQRSPSSPESMSLPLYKADRLAHEEAVRSGGLLMYFYGSPNPITGTNLATCIWTDRESAKKASMLPMHKEAVKLARGSYEWFELRRYTVVIDEKDGGGQGLRVEARGEESEE